MKTEFDRDVEPQALLEVTEWKASVWEGVKDLPFEEAVGMIASRAHETAIAFGFKTVESPARSLHVAEDRKQYTAGDVKNAQSSSEEELR